jgi:hypothetical protein
MLNFRVETKDTTKSGYVYENIERRWSRQTSLISLAPGNRLPVDRPMGHACPIEAQLKARSWHTIGRKMDPWEHSHLVGLVRT